MSTPQDPQLPPPDPDPEMDPPGPPPVREPGEPGPDVIDPTSEPLFFSACVLIPAAQDEDVDVGLQWHVSTLPFSEPLPDLTLTYGIAPEKTLPGPDGIQVVELPTNLNLPDKGH